ncbi:toxin-antitoxin system YwqK family antitoxin [Saccharothrix longispora]|jgi:antitoxin component YwqK of YwqJK toxin-antitoxin module|uniref:Antitoxin component YwqK of YwqJK toxin-antitoxin module n=1 Tax=Saccharothrix longispora TaxID=33920 RepID=A0ABU1PYN2_9PSEU|nr:hypothetical protein [Saccharothrix longispora]MDR6595742.1 antitoxin component YwqK of YwqJK toxin-antitoxin module [Saccharothrix longispora]MDU0294650.1 hypothetical protein [Saccharothrix longispora]
MRVEADEVEEDEGVVFHQGVPFTGEVVESRPDGTVLTLYTYLNGVEDGPYREWFDRERPYKEGEMRYGVPVGRHRRWHADGRLAADLLFGEGGDQLERREWDERGNLVTEWVKQR